MAGVTRLELATSGVTGRRSNQTELHTLLFLDPVGMGNSPNRGASYPPKFQCQHVDFAGGFWWAVTAVTFPINPSTY